MMLDSGARSSKEQIRQLSGIRGLMAKPKKTSSLGSEIIENPILSNFLEGLSILEYFISTHGARKGLADTALKTADAGYLTRRLVDSAQDVIIQEDDCKTLLGIKISAVKKKEKIIETLSSRVLGRIALNHIYDPTNNNVLIKSSQMIDEKNINLIEKASIVSIEVRSPLTCKSKTGICRKCYGRNLANGLMIQKGEAIGVIAAQSIGEPGTQLTLRTFHVGGTAGNIFEYSKIKDLGYYHAFKGGLSFNLNDISIPKEKKALVKRAIEKVSLVKDDYNLGLITNNERYNQIIDIWTNTNVSLTEKVINCMRKSKQGFNSVYMMLDSGARSSKEQIRQLSGIRELMAKPKKNS